MKISLENPKTQTPPDWFMPTIEEAVDQWRFTRRRFLLRASSGTRDEFDAANELLFVAFLNNDAEKPWAEEAFQGFRRTLAASEPDTRCGEHGI